MAKNKPKFRIEPQGAAWLVAKQVVITERPRATAGASPTITIRLPEHDLARAKTLAAERGLRYQTYLKMLLRQALDSEEKRSGHR